MAKMQYGTNRLLEEQADEILRESLEGVTKHSDKDDILTPWKARDRRGREVHSNTGTVDPALRRGIFGRSANPVQSHLNSVVGHSQKVTACDEAGFWHDGTAAVSVSIDFLIGGGS